MPDLKNVLGGINAVIFYPIQPSPSDACVSGEHVIVAWRCKEYMWELGVVEKITNEKIYISHLIPTNKNKSLWVFPEEAIVHPVEKEQSLLRRVKAIYHQSLRIRVSLDSGTVKEADDALEEFIKQSV